MEEKQLTKQDIEKIITDKIDEYMNKKQFNLSKIPSHSHTGIDVSQVDGRDIDITSFILFKSAVIPTASPLKGQMYFDGTHLYFCKSAGSWTTIT